MKKFVNLTPHTIFEVMSKTEYPIGGTSLRIDTMSEVVEMVGDTPIYMTKFGELNYLPSEENSTIYIVSALVLNAIPERRKDFVAPGNLVRDNNGNPIGCRGFRFK